MTETELNTKTQAVIAETREVIELFRDNINKGQLKQLLKNEKIRKVFDRYGVKYETEE